MPAQITDYLLRSEKTPPQVILMIKDADSCEYAQGFFIKESIVLYPPTTLPAKLDLPTCPPQELQKLSSEREKLPATLKTRMQRPQTRTSKSCKGLYLKRKFRFTFNFFLK